MVAELRCKNLEGHDREAGTENGGQDWGDELPFDTEEIEGVYRGWEAGHKGPFVLNHRAVFGQG